MTALVRRAAEFFPGVGVVIVAPDEDWKIRADPLIERVFYNLIENALRHGSKVGRVRFSVEELPAGGALIVCEDDGAGVPVNEKERIFERGYGRNTGLGLYLSSEILATTGMTFTETGRPGIGAQVSRSGFHPVPAGCAAPIARRVSCCTTADDGRVGDPRGRDHPQ